MKTVKRWIEISDKQKAELIERLSLLLIWLTKEKKIEAKEIAMRIGIPGSVLSHIKNKKIDMVTNWKVILTAVSFKIDLPDFDTDQALGDIKQNKWDSPFFDHPLASNLYHVEIAYFNLWYGKHEREAIQQFRQDQLNAVMAGTRVHEAMEEKILGDQIVEMLGAGEVVEKTLFDEALDPKKFTGFIGSTNKPVLGKSLASIIKESDKPEIKDSPIFESLAGAIREGQRFNVADHMPKETDNTKSNNRLRLLDSSRQRKKDIQSEIKAFEAEIYFHDTEIKMLYKNIEALNTELAAIARVLKLYGE